MGFAVVNQKAGTGGVLFRRPTIGGRMPTLATAKLLRSGPKLYHRRDASQVLVAAKERRQPQWCYKKAQKQQLLSSGA